MRGCADQGRRLPDAPHHYPQVHRKAERGLFGHDCAQTVVPLRLRHYVEPFAGIEGCIPRHIAQGGQHRCSKAGGPGLRQGMAQQCTAVATTRMRRVHIHLQDMELATQLAAQQRAVGADERVVADGGGRLVHAVVVAGDGAGTDVHPAADHRITQIGEVIGLAADTEGDLLGLDEVADVHAIGQHGTWAQARERTDQCRAFGDHAFQITMRAYFGARAESDVLQPVERTNGGAVTEHDVAFENNIDVDQHIAAHGDGATDIQS
uniref:Uncharacterized protein n=1 Tax=Panagrolaimus superbus TaxID=310955 RepID=A0A914YBS6_9BILA